MEDIIELILDLLFDISNETIKNKKVSKYIRIPLIVLMSIVTIIITLLIIYLGIHLIKTELVIGILFLVMGTALAYFFIYKIRKIYEEKKKNI